MRSESSLVILMPEFQLPESVENLAIETFHKSMAQELIDKFTERESDG